MIDFIAQNIYSIALLAITAGVLFYSYRIGKETVVKKILKQLIIKAELYYESGQGAIKKKYVINEFYEKAKILSVFLSREELSYLVELVLVDIKTNL